jgi:predicted nucleotidyltransferase
MTTATARSIAEIHEPRARAWLEEEAARPDTLGILLVGSRANGWGAPNSDYDAFVYVSPERYRAIAPKETLVWLEAEGEFPARVVGDFSIMSPEHLDLHERSPLDIDHWPYVDAVLLHDRTGRLEEARRRIAAFPEAGWKERAIDKYVAVVAAYSYAVKSEVAGLEAQRQLNIYRATLAAVSLWFTLQHRWAPPYKWFVPEIERLAMRPDTRGIIEGALSNPSIDTLTHLRDHLKTEMKYAGIVEVASREAFLEAFAASFHPDRAAGVYRSLYL